MVVPSFCLFLKTFVFPPFYEIEMGNDLMWIEKYMILRQNHKKFVLELLITWHHNFSLFHCIFFFVNAWPNWLNLFFICYNSLCYWYHFCFLWFHAFTGSSVMLRIFVDIHYRFTVALDIIMFEHPHFLNIDLLCHCCGIIGSFLLLGVKIDLVVSFNILCMYLIS